MSPRHDAPVLAAGGLLGFFVYLALGPWAWIPVVTACVLVLAGRIGDAIATRVERWLGWADAPPSSGLRGLNESRKRAAYAARKAPPMPPPCGPHRLTGCMVCARRALSVTIAGQK